MLSSISWGQFLLFMLVATCVYYGYVAVRFYRIEISALLRGQRPGGPAGQPAVAGAVPAKQGSIFPSTAPTGSEDAEMFKVMEKVVGLLKGLISDGVTSGIGREDLLDHIRGVLGSYRQLRKTPYQEAINNFLERSCATNFSLPLSAEDLAGLWDK
jgi:hypothetical protein